MTPMHIAVLLSSTALLGACSTSTPSLSPAEAGAKVPPVAYTSATSEFQTGPEIERPESWQMLNDRMLRLGGQQGHLGDAPDDAVPTPLPPTDRNVRRVPLPDASAKPR